MKRKNLLIFVLAVLATVAYGLRVYHVNSPKMLARMPNKIAFEVGTRVEMYEGFYDMGYADLRGYHIQVNGTKIVKAEELLAEHGLSMDFLRSLHVSDQYQYVYIVTATFDYEGDRDPLANAVDLSSMKVVGPDFYLNFSTEINQIKGLNPKLEGNHMFSIGSGKPIEIVLPFLVDTESVRATTPEYLGNSELKLLISTYPDEVYIKLDSHLNK